jgi:microcystin-dependent protein
MEGTIGEIRMFAGNFAPKNWAFCQGQLLAIQSNTALFSILGTTYGGNGTTNFALPDLQGRVPVGAGTGPGLPTVVLGEIAGTNTNTLTISEMPMHTHTVAANAGTAGRGLQVSPTNNFPAQNQDGSGNYAPTPDTTMNPQMVGLAGGSQPVNNMQPYLGMNYVICLYGIFPSRN